MGKISGYFKVIFFCLSSFIIINLGFYVYAYITPKTSLKYANKIIIYDNDNNIAFENVDGSKWVKLDDISSYVIEATIAAEDKNFFKHQGFDYLRIIKAFINNIIEGSITQGASTISQQYVKNLYLEFDKTWKRKIEEAFLTFELETHYSKEEILEGYLNTINYGAGNYGIENASNYYFGKSAKNLSVEEATILVGIPKNPTLYNPITNFKNAKYRQKMVLESMLNNKIIDDYEYKSIYNKSLVFNDYKTTDDYNNILYYKDAVLQELEEIETIPKALIDTGGLKIYTNLDLNVQKKLENIIDEEMKNENDLQVSSIIIEPNTGKVLALVGGKDYSKSQYNRVTQSKRQVGSTIKPFLYYAALENGFTASSTFTSEKTTFNLGNGKTYSPKNYGDKYANKDISLASAIVTSDNIYAIKTHLFLGENVLVDTASKVGINAKLESNPSLPLGTNEINMLDFSNGYSTLANEGLYNKNYFITKITDMNNNVLYTHKYKEKKVLNNNYVYILNELLSNSYNYSFIDYASPTMLVVKDLLTKKYSIKSGSTDYDYWTIGYNPDLLVLVWNGYDNNKELESSKSIISKRIWARTMEEVLDNNEKNWYEIPDNITYSIVNPVSGKVDTTSKNSILFYLKGTEPEYNSIKKD